MTGRHPRGAPRLPPTAQNLLHASSRSQASLLGPRPLLPCSQAHWSWPTKPLTQPSSSPPHTCPCHAHSLAFSRNQLTSPYLSFPEPHFSRLASATPSKVPMPHGCMYPSLERARPGKHQNSETQRSPSHLTCLCPERVPQPLVSSAPHLSPAPPPEPCTLSRALHPRLSPAPSPEPWKWLSHP